MNLGELFIELGVVGDVKPLKDAVSTFKESVKQIDKQTNATKRLIKYRQDLAKATNQTDKKLIKDAFANDVRKQKLLDEAAAVKKNLDAHKAMAANVASTVKGIGVFIATVVSATAVLNKMTDSLIRTNQTWVNFARTTDLGLKSLQKYAGVASLLDKTLGVEGVAGSIEQLNKKLFELRLTGEGARGFQLAGVNPIGQNAFGVIEQLRSRFQGMDNTSATYLMEQMGIDPKLLPLIRLTRQEFEGLYSTIEKYQLSAQQREQIQAMNIQLEIAATRIRYLKDRAILAIMPALTKFMASVARVGEGLAKAVKWLTTTNEGAITLAATIVGVLIPAIKLLFTLITSHPAIAAITAIIGALYLLIDDIMAYFNGGGSMFGVLLAFFDEFKKNIENMNFTGIFDGLAQSLKVLSKIPASPILQQLIRAGQMVANIGGLVSQMSDTFGGNTTGSAASIGYMGQLPNLSTALLNPSSMQNSVVNNYDNRQVNQTNSIMTNQPVDTLHDELVYARNSMSVGFA